MIYELRTYTVLPRKMQACVDAAEKLRPCFERNGVKVVGYWTTLIGRSECFYYLCQFENLAAREEAFEKASKDPELRKYIEEHDPMCQYEDNVILKPTSYSPMQ